MTELIFGIADNGIMLLCALMGSRLGSKSVTNALLGGLIGNSLSDGAAGLIALDFRLAVGSFLGCGIVTLLYYFYTIIKGDI